MIASPHQSAFDVAVVGGGLVGMPVAWQLAKRGLSVVVLDEGDVAHRPSRGNFALVWILGKGAGMPAYARWSMDSAARWPELAALLADETGIDVHYRNPGGLMVALSERELAALQGQLQRLAAQPGMPRYAHEVLDRAALARLQPAIGPEVVGAIYGPLDGHVNSLRFFRALHVAARTSGVAYRPESRVDAILRTAGEFRIRIAGGGEIGAAKLVLAAGHDNRRLAPLVGLEAPVRAQRGQIIVTEKLAPFLTHPMSQMRQTDEGSVMVGDSLEEVGFDSGVGTGILGAMADRAVRTFPRLAQVNVVRAWAALRVMSPDGFPIYQQSETAAGAFVLTCHSGVTLAAAHAFTLSAAIAEGALPAELATFSGRRFDVSQAH